MSTIALRLSNECNGRCHGDLSIQLDNDPVRVLRQVDLASLLEDVSDDDLEGFIRILVRIARRTRTPAEIRTALLNIFTVTV